MTARAVLPWVLSCTTLTVMWLAGNKRREAWIVGLLSQALWAWFAVASHSYGLLPLTAALTVVYCRNFWRWRPSREESPRLAGWVRFWDKWVCDYCVQDALYRLRKDSK